jgi:hypothetical protein
MCAEASTVLRAVVADFFFNCWYLEIPSDNRNRHIPRCVHYHAQGFRLETFYGTLHSLHMVLSATHFIFKNHWPQFYGHILMQHLRGIFNQFYYF